MNSAQKLALLSKVLQCGTSKANRLRLQQVKDNSLRSLIIIDDLDFKDGQSMTDDDPVHFYNKGKEHRMTLGEAYFYAARNGVGSLFIFPAKREG